MATATKTPFATVEDAIEDIRAGRFVVVVDDPDRENEGDLVIAAQFATPDAINFMATHARGLICLSLTEERCNELGLRPMTEHNEARLGTAFTVSIEAREGVTTGISAHDRSRAEIPVDRKSTRLNSSHLVISYAVFCLKKKKQRYRRSSLTSLLLKRPHFCDQRIAVFAGHRDVTNQHVGLPFLKHFKRSSSIGTGSYLCTALLQRRFKHFKRVGLVINQQHTQAIYLRRANERRDLPNCWEDEPSSWCSIFLVANALDREAYCEGCSLSLSPTFSSNCAAVHLDNLTHNRHAQT